MHQHHAKIHKIRNLCDQRLEPLAGSEDLACLNQRKNLAHAEVDRTVPEVSCALSGALGQVAECFRCKGFGLLPRVFTQGIACSQEHGIHGFLKGLDQHPPGNVGRRLQLHVGTQRRQDVPLARTKHHAVSEQRGPIENQERIALRTRGNAGALHAARTAQNWRQRMCRIHGI